MSDLVPDEQFTLLDLLDRILDKGVAITGTITLAVADINLVDLELRIVLGATETLNRLQLTGASSNEDPA
jgi:hypothetical protein